MTRSEQVGPYTLTDSLPLILLTRPESASRRFLGELEAAHGGSIPALISPIIRIEPRPVKLDWPADTIFVFTSEAAVTILKDTGVKGLSRAYCVGDRTAEKARAAGFSVTNASATSETLVGRIIAEAPVEPLIHFCGAHRRGEIVARLNIAGLTASERVVYDQVSQPLSEAACDYLSKSVPIIAPLFSPRSASLLRDATRNARAQIRAVAISQAAAEAWAETDTIVASSPDARSMVSAVLKALS